MRQLVPIYITLTEHKSTQTNYRTHTHSRMNQQETRFVLIISLTTKNTKHTSPKLEAELNKIEKIQKKNKEPIMRIQNKENSQRYQIHNLKAHATLL